MFRLIRSVAIVVATLVALAGCSKPETPQEVTRAFWESLMEGDGKEVAELSTLMEDTGFDGYAQDWNGVSTSWGRVTIDGDKASIVTILEGLEGSDGETLQTTTYLVRVSDQWLVDYHRTGDALADRPVVDELMGKLQDLGDRIRSRFSDESDKAAREMERMAEELAALSAETEKAFADRIETYSEQLEQQMEALSRSIDEALKDNESVPQEDRQTLDDARKQLDQQSRELDESEPDTIARASKTLAEVQLALSRLSSELFAEYQGKWRDWSADMEKELRQLTEDTREKERNSI